MSDQTSVGSPYKNSFLKDEKAFHVAIENIGLPLHFRSGAEIYGENEPSEYLYKVTSGTVLTYKVLGDGRRQIGSFCFPGDIFGLEMAGKHALSAEAVSDAKILAVKRSLLFSLAARDNKVIRHIWALTAAELQCVQNHFLTLIATAQERVVGFLLKMAKRSAVALEVDLPMTRQDIADYLGITVETVSRTLTELETSSFIVRTTPHHLVLRDRAALQRISV